MRAGTLALGLMLGIAALPGGAAAQTTIVVPMAYENAEAPGDNAAPFFLGALVQSDNWRYQQIYPAFEFSALLDPVWIHEIAFRVDGDSGSAFLQQIPDIEMRLSTAIGLGTTFDLNVGPDETVVLSRGPLTIGSANSGPMGGPKDWEVRIPFDAPFFYDRTQGSLLLDIWIYEGSTDVPPTGLDTENGTMSRTLCASVMCTVNDATGGMDSLGAITRFTLPEPDGATARLCGLLTLAGVAARSLRGGDPLQAPEGRAQ
ncbi:MAG: hypothetical protein QNK03_12325 [Myxococcota bacterium]|nr:hypothetical protein [Myxococcota bacterium]